MAYPFRKPFWTNLWFTISAVLIFALNCLFLIFNYEDFFLCRFFDVLSYPNQPEYKIRVVVGIVLCSIVTVITEKIIAQPFTKWYDIKCDNKAASAYKKLMEDLRMKKELS